MSEFRKRLLVPMAPPVIGALFVIVLVFSLSRILLAVPEMASTLLATVIAAQILAVCAVLAAASRLKAVQRAVLIVTALALIAGGGVAAGMGVRTIERHGLELAIIAEDIEFNGDRILLPPNSGVQIRMDNRDNGILHDVVVTRDESGRERVSTGESVPGPQTGIYSVEPLDVGSYFFHCSIHPAQMRGDVSVSEDVTEPELITAEPEPRPTVPSVTTPPVGPRSDAATSATIVARNSTFDTDRLTLRAGATVRVTLDNQDPGVPHNWSVYTERGGDVIFREDWFNGVAQRTYSFQAPGAGEYFFVCDVHPATMTGTVIFE